MAWGFATLAACGGKSASDNSDARGGSGPSSGGSVTGGTSGSSSGGTSGAGGAPTCANAPAGTLCVRGTPVGENETLAVGDRLRIDVMPAGCYSSSCTEVVTETCSIAGVGPDFVATAQLCLASNTDPRVGCTDDCGGASDALAKCESEEGLEAGDYTVALGDLSVSFTVPGTMSVSQACVGSRF